MKMRNTLPALILAGCLSLAMAAMANAPANAQQAPRLEPKKFLCIENRHELKGMEKIVFESRLKGHQAANWARQKAGKPQKYDPCLDGPVDPNTVPKKS